MNFDFFSHRYKDLPMTDLFFKRDLANIYNTAYPYGAWARVFDIYYGANIIWYGDAAVLRVLCLHGNRQSIDHFILTHEHFQDWDFGLSAAAEGNHDRIVHQMIALGARDIDQAISCATSVFMVKELDKIVSAAPLRFSQVRYIRIAGRAVQRGYVDILRYALYRMRERCWMDMRGESINDSFESAKQRLLDSLLTTACRSRCDNRNEMIEILLDYGAQFCKACGTSHR